MKSIIKFCLLGFVAVATTLNAQTTFKLSELNPYFSEYLSPMTSGLALGMGQGWVHRVKPHRFLGFDVKVSGAVLQIPSSLHNFNGTALSVMSGSGYALQQNGTTVSFDRELPTIVSSSTADYGLKKTIEAGSAVSIDVPLLDGLDLPYAGNAAVQLALGISDRVEIMGRFIPDMSSLLNRRLNINKASVSELNMWGVGVKYNIKEWIPIVKRIPVMHLSVLLAYSEFNLGIISNDLQLNPSELVNGSSVINDPFYDNDPNIYDQQGIGMCMNSLTGAVLLGAYIPVLHPYVGIGFNQYSVDAGLRGNFPVIQVGEDDAVDIIAIEKNALSVVDSNFKMNLQFGINFKIAIININAQYTLQDYSMLSVGVSVGMR